MQTKFHMTKAERLISGRRGNAKQRELVLVGGQYVTYDDMASRLGLNREQARSRYSGFKRRGIWPVTWEILEGK